MAARLLFGNGGGPDAKLTGGFQEGTCLRCHNSHGLNDGCARGGIFKMDGVPRKYEPGCVYPLTVTVGQPGQSRWGFAFSACAAGSGQQSGQLAALDGLAQVKTEAGIQYMVHSAEGTRKGEQDGPVTFRFNWTAPAEPAGLIIFNAAGNCANGDGTPAGDFIYTAGSFT